QSAQGAAWFWLAIYAGVPVAMLIIWMLQLRAPGGDPPRGPPAPMWMRIAVLAQGAGMLAVGVGLFLAPDVVKQMWPWFLTPLTARAIGAWLIGIGFAAFHASRENDFLRIRPLGGGYIAFAILQFIAIARYSGEVNWSSVAANQTEVYKAGLNFPIALAFSSDGRIFFAEKDTGSIRIIYRDNRTLLPTPFYTLPNTDNAGERGLLDLALDPGFPSSPYLYAYQTYDDITNVTIYNRIVRITANGNLGTSYTVILRLPPLSGATNHNGGVIAFGSDGKLWAVVGEN